MYGWAGLALDTRRSERLFERADWQEGVQLCVR